MIGYAKDKDMNIKKMQISDKTDFYRSDRLTSAIVLHDRRSMPK